MVGRVASELRRYKILQFYHIDLTLNDIPDLNLIYIPAFGVFKGNSKEPIIYQDEKISERRILDFVTETTELLSPQEYANLKKEIEVMQFDELMVRLLNNISPRLIIFRAQDRIRKSQSLQTMSSRRHSNFYFRKTYKKFI